MVARLTRMLPLLIVFVIAAAIMYVVLARRHSPARATEAVIRLFSGITLGFTVFFGLACLYAWFEHNEAVLDLAVGFLVVSVLAFLIARIRRSVFIKRNPNYRARLTTSSFSEKFRRKK